MNITTVAQKTAPMFAHFSMIALVQHADIIQGFKILFIKLHILASHSILDHVIWMRTCGIIGQTKLEFIGAVF